MLCLVARRINDKERFVSGNSLCFDQISFIVADIIPAMLALEVLTYGVSETRAHCR